MWNTDVESGTHRPDLAKPAVRPPAEPYLPKTNLQAIVSILAIGVLRRRARNGASRAMSGERRRISKYEWEKDLLSSANRAFMPNKRVQQGNEGVTRE